MSRSKTISIWFVKFAISAGILYYLFLKTPFSDVVHALMNAKIIYLLSAICLQLFLICINAFQMKIFVSQQKMNLAVPEIMRINFMVFFYRLFLPGEAATGIVRWHKLSKPDGMRAQSLACIIMARTINMFTLAFIGIVFFSIEQPCDNNYINISLVSGLFVSFLLLLLITNKTLSLKTESTIQKMSFLPIPKLVKEKVGKVWNSIKEFHNISSKTKFSVVLISFSYHFIEICSLNLFMSAVGIKISIISIAWIMAAVTFLQMLPISISGLGVREGAFVFLLKKYSVLGSDAMALSLLILSVSVTFAFIGGIFEAIEFFKRDKGRI